MKNSNAIVLAMFGTSVEKAIPGLLNIRDRMVVNFPATTVRFAFTSKILRRIWHQRAEDSQYCADHPEIPVEVFGVHDPLAVVADLRDAGHSAIVMQPVYMTPAEEYRELLSMAESFRQDNSIQSTETRPLQLVVGRPALGLFENGSSVDDITAAARVLACDAGYAREKNAALVYMGHGSKNSLSTEVDVIYQQFATTMHRLYPDVLTYVATVEGSLSVEKVLLQLQKQGVGNIILKPFMVVAGDHVRKDMIGLEPRGWKNRLEKAGFAVEPVLSGLGEQDAFVTIFIQHAADAAAEAGIRLD